ncbi:Gfo/Idh/MocA family protein [Chloroflexota bacterium]
MIGCALIGCGYWGSKLKRYIEENPGVSLKYVCNSSSDLDAVWQDPQVTAVVVATPNVTHYPIVKSALLHDKNVLSEKPLALTAEECVELRQIASSRNLKLLVEYTYTFSRALRQAQQMVEEGEIGAILGIEMMVRHLGRFGGGSVYWLLSSHMLSVLDMFIPLESTSFTKIDLVTYQGEEETGVICFRYQDILGQLVVSLNYPGKETRIIIYGENGTIIYDPAASVSLLVEQYQRLKWTVAAELPRKRREFQIDESHNLRYAINYFLAVLEGREESNVDRAVTITEILEKLRQGQVG